MTAATKNILRSCVSHLPAFVALASMAVLPACSGSARRGGAGNEPMIRALVAERETVEMIVSGAFTVESGGMALLRSAGAATVSVTRDGNSLVVRMDPPGSSGVTTGEAAVVPGNGADITIDDVAYAGRMVIKTGVTSKLYAVNVLPLEGYLEGVVPHEIGNPGPDAYAALEAQAVTARTYALGRIELRRAEPFDVFAGVRDQVYRGKERDSRAATAAIRDTRGEVLQNGGKLGSTYYSATCGGHTSDIRRVWPQRDPAPYLYGSYDRMPGDTESFCSWVRNFRWRYSFSGKEMGRILRKTIPLELGVPAARVGRFLDVRVAETSPSGRVRRVEIETTGGTFTVEGDRIRWVLMADIDKSRILPSTLFAFEKTMQGARVSTLSIVGGGNGHGVGMCQNGAIGMARKGYSYRMILSHYYPGTELARRY
jgi:stage II sporulation protein D